MKKKRDLSRRKSRSICCRWVLLMKSIGIFMLGMCFAANASVLSQIRVTIDFDDVPLAEVLEALSKQAQCDFFYNSSLIKTKGTVKIKTVNKELTQVLEELLPELGLDFTFDNHVVVIREKSMVQQPRQVWIDGRVTDINGDPIYGVSVQIKGTKLGTVTDREGRYRLGFQSGAKWAAR